MPATGEQPSRAGSGPPSAGRPELGARHKRVQRLRRLLRQSSYRSQEGAFVIEGTNLLHEALDGDATIEAVFVAAGTSHPVLDRALDAGLRVHALGPGVLERVATTVTPQPVVAIAAIPAVHLDTLRHATFVVVCADLRDPGNLGTVLRSAEAAGAGGVVCCDGSVDAFNPKTVRASAGSVFHVPVVNGGDAVEVLRQLGEWGLPRVATAARGGTPYHQADLQSPVAVVLGNEAHGLSDAVAACTDATVSIPMAGRSESLNVGMAAAVVCMEVLRQRGIPGDVRQ